MAKSKSVPTAEGHYLVIELGDASDGARVIEEFVINDDSPVAAAKLRRWALQEGYDSAGNRKRDRAKQILVVRVEWASDVPTCTRCEWAAPDCTCGSDDGWTEEHVQ